MRLWLWFYTRCQVAWLLETQIEHYGDQLHFHQKFQVPKMEVLNLIRLFLGWVFPYISLTYSLHRRVIECLHFRYLKCLVTFLSINSIAYFMTGFPFDDWASSLP